MACCANLYEQIEMNWLAECEIVQGHLQTMYICVFVFPLSMLSVAWFVIFQSKALL
jgi:hypothetical protein